MTLKQRFIVWLAQYVTPCQVVAHRLSCELDGQPGWRERLSTRMHLLICVWCRRYRDQLKVIKSAARRAGAESETTDTPIHHLSNDSRDRIRRALRDSDQ